MNSGYEKRAYGKKAIKGKESNTKEKKAIQIITYKAIQLDFLYGKEKNTKLMDIVLYFVCII